MLSRVPGHLRAPGHPDHPHRAVAARAGPQEAPVGLGDPRLGPHPAAHRRRGHRGDPPARDDAACCSSTRATSRRRRPAWVTLADEGGPTRPGSPARRPCTGSRTWCAKWSVPRSTSQPGLRQRGRQRVGRASRVTLADDHEYRAGDPGRGLGVDPRGLTPYERRERGRIVAGRAGQSPEEPGRVFGSVRFRQ